MDESFYQEKMKAVDDDPTHRCKPQIIDLAAFTPKYSNVIIVDVNEDRANSVAVVAAQSPTAVSVEGPIQRELVVNSVWRARDVIICFGLSSSSFCGGWTIILKDFTSIRYFIL